MGLGDTLRQWIDARAAEWKGRLAGWAIDSAINGAEAVAAHIEPQALNLVKEQIDKLRKTEGLPPEVKALLDKIIVPADPTVAIALLGFLIGLVSNLASGLSKQMLQPVMQNLAKLSPYNLPGLSEVIDLKLRRGMSQEEFEDLVLKTGWSVAWADRFMDLKHPTLPSEMALSASLRDPVKYKWAVDNLPRLGLTPADIELLTELAFRVPSAQDVIRYAVREAYTDDPAYKAALLAEYPSGAEADVRKAGMRPDHLEKEWMSHWELPGVSQAYEMMHRGEITPQGLADLLKYRDILPFWRSKLTAISWSLPGRIELRMMALYGLIGKKELMTALEHDGLAEEFRAPVANMNLIRGIKTDIQTRYTNGWIGPEEVLSELTAQLEDADMALKVYKTIVKNASGARTATQKSLTLAQIEKGVKKGKLTRPEAITLITDIGYDAQEAAYLLAVDVSPDDTDAAVANRELTKADILDGLESHAIQPPEALTRLIGLRYTPADANYILRVYALSIKPPETPKLREISKADVVAAVKRGLVSPEEGYKLLIKIGFAAFDATFILSLVPESSPFSPLNFDEFKALTGSWRRSQGLTDEVLPPAAQELRLAQAQAVAEGREPVLETLRIQIDTIRRQRRSGALTRDAEIAALTKLQVPADYLAAIVANDDARIAARK